MKAGFEKCPVEAWWAPVAPPNGLLLGRSVTGHFAWSFSSRKVFGENTAPRGLEEAAAARRLTSHPMPPAVPGCLGKRQSWSAEDERRVMGRTNLSLCLPIQCIQ